MYSPARTKIRFRWPSKDEPGGTFDDATHMTARLCSRSGRICIETDRTALAGDAVRLCAYQQIGGAFDLVSTEASPSTTKARHAHQPGYSSVEPW